MAFSDTKQYRFTNTEGAAAKDLHIEFNHGVTHNPATQQNPAGTFPEVDGGSGESTIGLGGEFGAGVAVGASVTLTFTYDGTTPQVKKWWWTKNGDPEDDSNGNRLGAVKYPKKGQYDLAYVPSTGDGSMTLTLFDGDSHTFDMPAAVSGADMVQLFSSFIADVVPWAEVEALAGTSLIMFPTSFSGDLDFQSTIVPDTTQSVSFNHLPQVIPTLSEWGVIILILLVLAVGMVFLLQRKPALASAGGPTTTEVSNAGPKLFDRKLYLKVFSIVLLIGVAALAGAYLYFGQLTNADPFGVFVSAAVVAYMVHLQMLRKTKE